MFRIIKGYSFFPRAICVMFVLAGPLYATPCQSAERTQFRDFYSEPGLSPFRSPLSENTAEVIDTLSGNLSLSFVDLVVPGNGGMDIKIQRSYNSNNIFISHKTLNNNPPTATELLHRTPTGMGWTLHFGRVLKTKSASEPSISVCEDPGMTSIGVDSTLNNAILELPDGTKTTLYVNATPFSTTFITKEQWVASCTPTAGLLVISPDGKKYTMDYRRMLLGQDFAEHHAWYTRRIEDRNGNWINIDYDDTAASTGMEPVFKRLTAGDAGSTLISSTVDFTYVDRLDSNKIRLASITANGQTWNYNYTPLDNLNSGYYQLTQVDAPGPFDWSCAYYSTSPNQANSRLLQTVTHPHGAKVTYNYGYKCLNSPNGVCDAAGYFNSLVVASKTNGGRDAAAGTWSFSYAPSTVEDVTTVMLPGVVQYTYRHFGTRAILGSPTI